MVEATVSALVVVKPDGTVPFDDTVPPHIKQGVLGYLVSVGHEVFVHPDTGKHTIRDWGPNYGIHPHEFSEKQKKAHAARGKPTP